MKVLGKILFVLVILLSWQNVMADYSEDVLKRGFLYDVFIIVGEENYYGDQKYIWLDAVFYQDKYSNEAVCILWIEDMQFWNGSFLYNQNRGRAMTESAFYYWIDQGYYLALDRGLFLGIYFIPEPATIALLGFGGLSLLESLKKTRPSRKTKKVLKKTKTN